MIHAHASMPEVKFFEEVRIDFHKINRGRIRQANQLHEAKQHEEIVQIHELFSQSLLIAC